jgi:TolB-like protein/Tfp pilus assembly protein PilF
MVPHQSRPHLVRFGDFEVNLRSGELRRNGLRIKLPNQSFRALSLLLENPGEVATRLELAQKLWGGETFVDFDAGLNSVIRRLRTALGDLASKPRFIETLPRHGYRFLARVERESQEDIRSAIGSLAVLPLENLTGDSHQEYFVDGMTDALITRLAQIGALRVISRTSAMHYKRTRKKLPEIGRELNVDAVVEGSVFRSGSNVRITAQLVYAASDRHLWASQYERNLTDILLLQAEVASAIANEVQVRLTPQERGRLASARLVNPEAYQAYLRGRLHWNKRTEDGMKKGLELFRQALDKDPSYALSHAGIAECYNMMGYWGVSAPHHVSPQAKAASSKALEIDENLAEGHAARGWAQFSYDWDWGSAEKELQRAIQLNPGYATAHQWYSHLLIYQGRHAEALTEVQRTLELDPLSLVMNSNCAFIYLWAHQYGQAIERVHRTLDLDPYFAPPYLCLGCALQKKGLHAQGLEALCQAVRLSANSPRYLAGLGHGYAVAGKADRARAMLSELEKLSKERYVSAYDFAILYAGLGEYESVFGWLEKAYEEHSTWLALVNVDPRFAPFHSDPRFRQLLTRLDLAPG